MSLRLLSHDKKHFALCKNKVKRQLCRTFSGSLFGQVIYDLEIVEVIAILNCQVEIKSISM